MGVNQNWWPRKSQSSWWSTYDFARWRQLLMSRKTWFRRKFAPLISKTKSSRLCKYHLSSYKQRWVITRWLWKHGLMHKRLLLKRATGMRFHSCSNNCKNNNYSCRSNWKTNKTLSNSRLDTNKIMSSYAVKTPNLKTCSRACKRRINKKNSRSSKSENPTTTINGTSWKQKPKFQSTCRSN